MTKLPWQKEVYMGRLKKYKQWERIWKMSKIWGGVWYLIYRRNVSKKCKVIKAAKMSFQI